MTEHEIRLIEDSWAAVAPISGDAAALFYDRLFEIDPRVRSLFKGDMEQQGKKLMQMIGVAVAHLGRTEEIAPAVRALGQRHAGYGVQLQDYDTVGAALLWTLGKGLGAAFTPEVRAAWSKLYIHVAETMKAGQTADV